MPFQIVTENVSLTVGAAPLTLQQTGAIVSQGGTNLAAGTTEMLTQASDLTPYLAAPLAINALSWSSGLVTVGTTAAIPGVQTGDTFITTLAGQTPAGYSGQVVGTVTGANAFTFPLASNPGAETGFGTYTPPGQGELLAAVASYFGQGTSVAIEVLELGPADGVTGPALLASWITSYPGIFYGYTVPRNWDGTSGITSLIAGYASQTSKVYFFVTTTPSTWSTYAGKKCVIANIEAPGLPLTEFDAAAIMQEFITNAPSAANRMTPFAFRFLDGVTQYPTKGNAATLAAAKAAFVNVVGNTAEGGLTNAALYWGTTMDGNDAMFWWAADWMQLNGDLVAANAVLNGNNSGFNPLVYNQFGIDQLQDVEGALVNTGISYGILNGAMQKTTYPSLAALNQDLENGAYPATDIVNAIPFLNYTAANPNDYGIGKYAGLAIVAIPQTGFKSIVIAINITNLLTL